MQPGIISTATQAWDHVLLAYWHSIWFWCKQWLAARDCEITSHTACLYNHWYENMDRQSATRLIGITNSCKLYTGITIVLSGVVLSLCQRLNNSTLTGIQFTELSNVFFLGVNADPHIHIIGGNGVTMRLLTRSALYCRLIADPYNLINGSSWW